MPYNINTKLLAFDGVIGRRDFLFNFVKICSIYLFFSLPYMLWTMTNIGSFSDYFALNKLFMQAPVLLKFWIITGNILICVLGIGNIIRRLNDINGHEEKVINTSVSVLYIVNVFGMFILTSLAVGLFLLNLIIGLILLFKEGKLTSQLPYDFRKEFNWGAFFGTWIWGLFNKSFIPLLHLLLFLTPWGFYFQLYCGFKGNEWAYKNKKWKNVDKFNSSQEKQAVFWTIFSVVILPILIFAIIFCAAFYITANVSSNPDTSKIQLEKISNTLNSMYFKSYNIKSNANEFFVNPNVWNSYSFDTKRKVLEYAATTSALKRNETASQKEKEMWMEIKEAAIMNDEEKYQKLTKKLPKLEFFDKTTELPRTKIYSAEDYQLLGEYVKNDAPKGDEQPKIIDIIKSELNAYKFYKAM